MRSPFDYSVPGSLLSVLRDGGGSGGDNQGFQQTKSTNEPPAHIRPMLQGAATELNQWYMNRGGAGGAPDYYPGTTVAPFSDQTKAALDWQTARAIGGSPLSTAAQNELTKTMRGDYLDPNTNPYFADALKASLKPQTENFMSTVLPGVNSTFAGSGRYGSGLHQDTVDRAITNLNRTQSDATVKAAADNYSMERQRQLDGMKFAPALANQDYFDINQLGVVGSALDDQKQREIDADVARYDYDQNKVMNYIARYAGALNGIYPGGETTGYSTGYTPPRSGGGFSSIFGNAMSGAGMLMSALPMLGFSDERLKENIERVGATHEGLPLYRYNYKGDPTPQIGPMAQEVAEFRPEAVIEHPSGYLMVDYKAAAPGLF